jgi:hypothetical protein
MSIQRACRLDSRDCVDAREWLVISVHEGFDLPSNNATEHKAVKPRATCSCRCNLNFKKLK